MTVLSKTLELQNHLILVILGSFCPFFGKKRISLKNWAVSHVLQLFTTM